MVEEILVKEYLSTEMITAGEELLKRLDSDNAYVIAAYWIYTYEVGDWHLEFVSPQVESKGPLEFYSKIRDLLSIPPKIPSWLDLNIINVLGPNYSFYKELRASIKYRKELTGVRLNRHVVGNQLVDLYIYRFAAKGATNNPRHRKFGLKD